MGWPLTPLVLVLVLVLSGRAGRRRLALALAEMEVEVGALSGSEPGNAALDTGKRTTREPQVRKGIPLGAWLNGHGCTARSGVPIPASHPYASRPGRLRNRRVRSANGKAEGKGEAAGALPTPPAGSKSKPNGKGVANREGEAGRGNPLLAR